VQPPGVHASTVQSSPSPHKALLDRRVQRPGAVSQAPIVHATPSEQSGGGPVTQPTFGLQVSTPSQDTESSH
jgi:hypothetical protein